LCIKLEGLDILRRLDLLKRNLPSSDTNMTLQ